MRAEEDRGAPLHRIREAIRRFAPTGLPLLLLAALTLAAFWPVLENDFVNYDDGTYVVENVRVRKGLTWDNLKWAGTAFEASNWHPLTWLSHMLDVELFGFNPLGHHLTSLFLHLANVILLYLLLEAMTAKRLPGLLAAALFAVHPLHVEAVAWVAERKELLAMFFGLLTLGAYLSWARRPAPARYAAAVMAFALGLLSKPMLVTLPLLLLLLDIWPLGRLLPRRAEGEGGGKFGGSPPARLVLEKIPFFLMAAASGMVTLYAQMRGGAMGSFRQLPLSQRLANAVISYVVYLAKAVWPKDLAVFYPYPQVPPPLWKVLAAALGLAAVSLMTAAAVRRGRPFLFTGWFWFILTLLPVIGLIQVGGQARADRYTYLPLIGAFIAAVWCIGELAARRRRLAAPALLAAALCLGGLTAASRVQTTYWRNDLTLFSHALEVTKDNWLAGYNLGNYYLARNDFAAAARMYFRALAALPAYPQAHNNLGIALMNLGREEEGLYHFREALNLKPDHVGAHMNLGLVLYRRGDLQGAAFHFRQALLIDPGVQNAADYLREIGKAQIPGSIGKRDSEAPPMGEAPSR